MLERVKLPYSFDALEPHIDAETMELHYEKHYKKYTDEANRCMAEYSTSFTNKQLFNHQDTWMRHNFGGWWNHTFFFEGLAPDKNEISTSSLLYAEFPHIIPWFYDNINLQNLYASGYVWLLIYPNAVHHSFLYVHYTKDQKCPIFGDYWPLLNIDLWEHAYYLKHRAQKQEYINNIFNVINWEKVDQRLTNFIESKERRDARYEPA